MKVGFVGFGELGRQMRDLVCSQFKTAACVYFDDVCHSQGQANAYRFEQYADETWRDLRFYVCLGYKHLKKNSKSLIA